MNTVELVQFSLGNAFGILGQVTADLTQEQADWVPPGLANPIGALYWHTMSSVDYIVHKWCQGEEPLSQEAGWQERVLIAEAQVEGEETLEQMRAMRVNLPELHNYARAVAEAAQGWVASLEPKSLERKISTPLGEQTLAELLETFVIWHINAHCGEVAALKGCLGAKGYPF
jgi:hypothetical protein